MKFRPLRALAAAGALLIAVGGGVLAVSSTASAHTPELSCSAGVVSLTLKNYPAKSYVSVEYDGNPDVLTTFGPAPFRWSKSVDLASEHSVVAVVKGSDGQGNRTFAAHTTELCGYTPTPPATTPPPTEPPAPPVTTPPAAVVAPQIQDYVRCEGAAFVLDNTGSTEAVRYRGPGFDVLVPAGQAVHTDADGTLISPELAPYVITAGDRTWTFPAAADCTKTIVVPEGWDTAVLGKDSCGTSDDGVSVPVDTDEYSFAVDRSDRDADGVQVITVTATPRAGYQFPEGTRTSWTFTLTDTPCDSGTTPPTTEPTPPATTEPVPPVTTPEPTAPATPPATQTPAPSAQPTVAPSPTPSAAGVTRSSTPATPSSATAVHRAAGSGELAFTGSPLAIGTGVAAALALLVGGALLLVLRHRRATR